MDDKLKCPKTRSATIWKSKPESQCCTLVSVLVFLVLVTIISENCRPRQTRLICWQLSWKQGDHDQRIGHWNSFHCKAFVLVTQNISLVYSGAFLPLTKKIELTRCSVQFPPKPLKEVAVRTFSLCVTTMLACDQCMIWLHVYCYHIFMPSPSDGLPYADRSFEHRQKVSFSFLQMV